MSNEGSKINPELSIVIPTYNEEEGITTILEDLCGELALNDAEIIVVDDGSTDRTYEIVQRFPRVRLIKHHVNKGYGASISTGIKASNGRYVVWCDSDGQHRAEDVSRVAHTLIIEDLDYCIGHWSRVRFQGSEGFNLRNDGRRTAGSGG